TLLIAGGIRYAHLSQDYRARRFASGSITAAPGFVTTFDQDSDVLLSGHNFDGAGPVFALEFRRPWEGTHLVFYGSTRGALLFGRGRQGAAFQMVQTGRSPNPVAGQPSSLVPFSTSSYAEVSGSRDDLLPVAEMEIGLEYGREVGRMYFFVQTALVGQAW